MLLSGKGVVLGSPCSQRDSGVARPRQKPQVRRRAAGCHASRPPPAPCPTTRTLLSHQSDTSVPTVGHFCPTMPLDPPLRRRGVFSGKRRHRGAPFGCFGLSPAPPWCIGATVAPPWRAPGVTAVSGTSVTSHVSLLMNRGRIGPVPGAGVDDGRTCRCGFRHGFWAPGAEKTMPEMASAWVWRPLRPKSPCRRGLRHGRAPANGGTEVPDRWDKSVRVVGQGGGVPASVFIVGWRWVQIASLSRCDMQLIVT